jgi:hypothetical protein
MTLESPYSQEQIYTPAEPIISKLRFYSAGIVAMNKLLSSKDIECHPIEEFPMVDGQLSDEVNDYKSKGKDSKGAEYETTVKNTVTVLATWLSLTGSNRITAPDVRRGELVMLYQFGDVDKYYWTTMKEDLKLRKLETVIYAFSATKDEKKDATPTTTYYFEISTHKKLIHLHTSKDNKEPYTYDIQLDTDNGKLTITDDVNNFIELISKEKIIHLENTDGTFIEIDKKKINMFASHSVNIKTPVVNISDDLVVGSDVINGGVISSGGPLISTGYVTGGAGI